MNEVGRCGGRSWLVSRPGLGQRNTALTIFRAGKEESDEREIVPLPVVFEIAKAVPVRYRALVLLATFADMRWGELVGLRRENIDLEACEIRIKETLAQPDKGGLRADTPKSQAGKRAVAFPAEIAPEIRWHLKRFAEPGERGFVFVGPKGGKLRRSNFHSRSGARPASRSACLLSISTTCGPSGRLSWAVRCPAVTVIDPCLPRLTAR